MNHGSLKKFSSMCLRFKEKLVVFRNVGKLWISSYNNYIVCRLPHVGLTLIKIHNTVGETCYSTNGPVRPEWYHGFTENRRETTLALCFAERVRAPEAHTLLKGRQRSYDSSGVAGVHGRRESLAIRWSVCSFARVLHTKKTYNMKFSSSP